MDVLPFLSPSFQSGKLDCFSKDWLDLQNGEELSRTDRVTTSSTRGGLMALSTKYFVHLFTLPLANEGCKKWL